MSFRRRNDERWASTLVTKIVSCKHRAVSDQSLRKKVAKSRAVESAVEIVNPPRLWDQPRALPVSFIMGKKLLLIGSQVALASVLGYFICLFLPLHKIYWKVGSFMDAVNMTVYALTVHYDWKMTRACKLVRLFVSKKDMCDKDVDGESASEHVALQDSASTWCSGGMQMTIRGACEGFKNAYIMGIMLLLFIIANLIMQGVGLFLIKEYMKKPKKQYRETAFFSISSAASWCL